MKKLKTISVMPYTVFFFWISEVGQKKKKKRKIGKRTLHYCCLVTAVLVVLGYIHISDNLIPFWFTEFISNLFSTGPVKNILLQSPVWYMLAGCALFFNIRIGRRDFCNWWSFYHLTSCNFDSDNYGTLGSKVLSLYVRKKRKAITRTNKNQHSLKLLMTENLGIISFPDIVFLLTAFVVLM